MPGAGRRGMCGTFCVLGAVLLFTDLVVRVDAGCPNACSGHGSCGSENQCTCFSGYQLAPDCSLRKFPPGGGSGGGSGGGGATTTTATIDLL